MRGTSWQAGLAVSAPCHVSFESAIDRPALEALYGATKGSEWRDSTNWLSAAFLADWRGFTTDSSGRVTNPELRDNGVSGTSPAELAELSNLREVGLRENQLSRWAGLRTARGPGGD